MGKIAARLAVGLAVLGGIIGLLFALGVVSLGGSRERESPELGDLGYLAQGVIERDKGRVGLTRKREQVEPGYAMMLPIGWVSRLGKAPATMPYNEVRLIDIDGEAVHRWSLEALHPSPNEHPIAYVLDDGSILAVIGKSHLGRIDWNGHLVWRVDGPFHHDIDVDPQGNIVAMQRPHQMFEFEGRSYPIYGQALIVMNAVGRLQRVIDIHPLFKDHPAVRQYIKKPQTRTIQKQRKRLDLYHLNSVEVMPADPKGRWEAGDYLISMRSIDLVAIIAHDGSEVRWSFDHNTFEGQHSPTVSGPDTILVFDNGVVSNRSRIVELDLSTNEIVWQYKGTENEPFFSNSRGMVNALAGGHVFVVDSNRGRMFEVDREGTIVWEYFNPDRFEGKYVPIRGEKIQGRRYEAIKARLERAASASR